MHHIAVLQQEVCDTLNPQKGDFIVDCTVGSGGHALSLCERLAGKGELLGIDLDPTALKTARQLLEPCKAKHVFVQGNFRDISKHLQKHSISTPTIILADLGWRIEQFDGSSGIPRGFSFQSDEPLHMTYGEPDSYPFTAFDIVNEWDEEDIANVVYAYGQERFSRRIAAAICSVRKQTEIDTSKQLAEVVQNALPKQYLRKLRHHPATKTFQGLRIAVNDEFAALTQLLIDGFSELAAGGKMGIITFHSLEDKIVKEQFRNYVRDQKGVLVHKKPIAPTRAELQSNPRARSAKLRTIQKL